jgi:aryl-alcohol dehydrogenase-like predicted oxidoreductase
LGFVQPWLRSPIKTPDENIWIKPKLSFLIYNIKKFAFCEKIIPSRSSFTRRRRNDMEYRLLGRSGVRVAPLALGTMNFGMPTDAEESIRIMQLAVDHGINLIDTANMYNEGESERIIGLAFQQGLPRQKVFLATKFFNPIGDGPNDQGGSRLHVIRACEDSLRRLQTDAIDLYQMHRVSFEVPVEETLSALTDLVHQGKVRYIGCSTFPAWKVAEALLTSEFKGYARFISEQPPYNLLDRRIENELIPLAQAYGLGLLPWSPMAQGVLAGRYPLDGTLPPDSRAVMRGGIYRPRVNQRGVEIGARVVELAKERGLTAAQLALLCVKDQPGVTAPIFGPRTVTQLEEALPVMEMHLSDEDRQALDQLNPPGNAVADYHNTSRWTKPLNLP